MCSADAQNCITGAVITLLITILCSQLRSISTSPFVLFESFLPSFFPSFLLSFFHSFILSLFNYLINYFFLSFFFFFPSFFPSLFVFFEEGHCVTMQILEWWKDLKGLAGES